jgi:hypothetical protein
MTTIAKLKSEECCPVFHSEKWNEKTFRWDRKPFIKASIPTFFHMPYPPMIGKQITRLTKLAEESNKLDSNKEEILVLFTDPHPFKSEIFLSVSGEVPDAKNASLTGTFISKVFDGKYNSMPKFMKEMDVYLEGLNKKSRQYYVHYAYCPKCAKEAGHNYMVLFAEVENPS